MEQYLDLLKRIKREGTYKSPARVGMPGTLSLFGHQMRFNLSKGFPLLTTKEIKFKHIVTELLWFLRGDTNIKYLVDNGCNIWNEDAYNYYLKVMKHKSLDDYRISFKTFVELVKKGDFRWKKDMSNETYKLGDCGKQYGQLWREWIHTTEDVGYTPIDQIADLIEGLNKNPMGRRHIITAWNPATLDDMALNACHAFVQFNCRPIGYSQNVWEPEMEGRPEYYLDCQMYQRSADVFLGVPYNIASYALLTEILAKICNMVPGDFIHTFGDVHIYDNHRDQVEEQLKRYPGRLPRLTIVNCPITGFDLDCLSIGQFKLEDYSPQPAIKAKLSTGLK